jgi:hypothetical protein
MAQLAVSVAGAAVGFAFGGPTGAQWGWMAGSVIGGLLFPMRVEGPRIADLRVQNSAYGQPIPITYGTFRLAGNVIWMGTPVEQSSSSGKGGPSTTTYSARLSFAVGLCEGPIVGVRRIWANAQLIYDLSSGASASNVLSSAVAAEGIRIYLGSNTQGPDPTMEAELGAGNVPGYRGLAYVVFTDFDLSTYGNALPALSFEVVTTSSPTWSSQTVATYRYDTTISTFYSAPCLSASATTVLAWGYYFGYDGMQRATLTPYGASPDGALEALAASSPGDFPTVGRSDTPGAFFRGATTMQWLDANSGTVSETLIPNLPYAGNSTTFIKSGSQIWATSSYGAASYPLYKSDIDNPSLVTSTTTGCWAVLGATASYVYVADLLSGAIKRFNATTLVQIGTVMTGPTGVAVGHVIDDGLIYVVAGSVLFKLDLVTQTSTRLTTLPTIPIVCSMSMLNDSTLLYTDVGPYDIRLNLAHASLEGAGVTLASIVSDLCSRVNLQAGQIDVTALTDTVQGYALTNRSSAKNNLAPLLQAYFADAADTNAKLKFVKRGASPALALGTEVLGAAHEAQAEEGLNPVIASRAQELDLPQTMELTYIGSQNDYDNGTQRAIRAATASQQKTTLQLPVVMRDDEARTRCELMLWSAWVSRTTFTFATTRQYLKLEPTDVVTVVDTDGVSHTVRLTKCEDDGQGQLRWTAVSEDPTLYSESFLSLGGSAQGYPTPSIAYAGPTRLVALDVPPLRDTDTSAALYFGVAGYDASWPGAQVQLSRDGVTFDAVATLTQAATIGFTVGSNGVLGTSGNYLSGNIPDETNTVDVQLISGSLSSTTFEGLLAGTNAAAIGQEIVYFRSATLIAANTYRLSGFLRARQGTEWAATAHAVGDTFVLLDTKLDRLPLLVTDLNNSLKLLGVTLGQTVSSAQATTLTVQEGCVRPLSPAQLRANRGSATSSADVTVSWIRRARVNAAWLNGTDVPLDESTESYQVQVFSGSTLKRTVTVSATQSWVYSAANIATDGFTTGQTITLTVAQNSDQGVLGHAATTTITSP